MGGIARCLNCFARFHVTLVLRTLHQVKRNYRFPSTASALPRKGRHHGRGKSRDGSIALPIAGCSRRHEPIDLERNIVIEIIVTAAISTLGRGRGTHLPVARIGLRRTPSTLCAV